MAVKSEIVPRAEMSLDVGRQQPQILTASPAVDIFENEDEIRLYADMAGVEKSDVVVNIDNGRLEFSGLRKMKVTGAAVWEEFGDVEYRRSFSVPQTIEVGKVKAELKEGVLCLQLPKSEAAKPKKIEIR